MKLSQRLTKDQIEPFFREWEYKSNVISEMHKQRNKEVKREMEIGIFLYEKLLAQCFDAEAAAGEKQLVPLNGEERLTFVATHSGSYAAFRQLDELFMEMKKMIAGKRVQLNRIQNGM